MPETIMCAKGHVSSELDYCSECGVKIGGPQHTAGQVLNAAHVTGGQACPDCGTSRGQDDIAFCEVCGYNFVTGVHGEIGIAPAPTTEENVPALVPEHTKEPLALEIATNAKRWRAVIFADEASRGAEQSSDPEKSFTVSLDRSVLLIGRNDEARAIFPEIALPLDEAVSRRHALLQQAADGALLLRDIGAANGTRLNGTEMEPMRDYLLHEGDEITLGHWSRIRIESE